MARDAGTGLMSMEALVELAQQGAYDKEAVQRLRASRSEALEELLKELWEPAMSVGLGGAWAVHAAWLASPERLAELATSGSHAVGVRALTALLKTDPARLIGLLGLPQAGGAVEGSPLSAARRRVSLRALGRLSHNALQGLVTEELLSELVSTDGASAARLLKGASPELIERWWPRLAVPSNTAVSIAARLPQLTLRLIVSSQQKQWADQELREVGFFIQKGKMSSLAEEVTPHTCKPRRPPFRSTARRNSPLCETRRESPPLLSSPFCILKPEPSASQNSV